MQRSTRFNRPTLRGSSIASLLFGKQESFVLKAGPDTTTSTSLTWTQPNYKPDNYRVERSTNGISFSTVATVSDSTLDYNDTGLTESTQYWYRIVPILGGADQPASNVADTWTVPSTPTTLTATAVGGTQIDLTWVDVSTGNTGQIIERRTPSGSGSYSLLATVSATATTYSDTGLTPGQSYEYRVAATNPATLSAYSNTASATPSATPTAAWSLDFSSGTPSGYTLTRASSGTYVDSSGYVASASTDVARLTHNSSGSRLGLLVEGQRTNLILASGTVGSGGGWAGSNLTLGTTTTAPDNTNTGRRFVENTTANAPHHYYQGATVGDCTCSIYAKKDQRDFLTLSIWVAVNNYAAATFDLANGTAGSIVYGTAPTQTVSSATARIEDAGNGWYRCIVSGVKTSGLTYLWFATATQASPSLDSYASQTYTGSTSNGLFVWGAQLEAASTASSYIPTTTASVTRSADLVHVLDSAITSWGDPGALVVHFYPPSQAGTLLSTDDASTAQVGIEASTTTAARAFWSSGSTATGTIGSGVQKAVHYWNGSSSKFCINGGTVQSGTNNFTIANADFVTLGAEATESGGVPGTFSQYANCVIRKVEFYSGTLTDVNLQTITT